MAVKLVDNTDKVILSLKEQLAQGINNAARYWTDEAKDLTPVDTGFMKEHIGQTIAANPNSLMAEIRSLAPYSGFVNYGTIKMAAQPFWTVAGLMTREKFDKFFRSGYITINRGMSAGLNIISAAAGDFAISHGFGTLDQMRALGHTLGSIRRSQK